jgi:hypothetical protein
MVRNDITIILFVCLYIITVGQEAICVDQNRSTVDNVKNYEITEEMFIVMQASTKVRGRIVPRKPWGTT